LGFFVFHKKI